MWLVRNFWPILCEKGEKEIVITPRKIRKIFGPDRQWGMSNAVRRMICIHVMVNINITAPQMINVVYKVY